VGASGNIGAEAVARAEPDGYTLLASPPPPLAINQSLFAKLPFDPGAFAPITVLAAVPNVLVANRGVPASTVQELLDYARANPDRLSYASTGNGGTPHLTAERLKAIAGVRIVHVPYKGIPAAIPDLVAGGLDQRPQGVLAARGIAWFATGDHPRPRTLILSRGAGGR
jgi:tripartite-type tricarboxylate transporter receptor subunit TctC